MVFRFPAGPELEGMTKVYLKRGVPVHGQLQGRIFCLSFALLEWLI